MTANFVNNNKGNTVTNISVFPELLSSLDQEAARENAESSNYAHFTGDAIFAAWVQNLKQNVLTFQAYRPSSNALELMESDSEAGGSTKLA